MGAGALSPHKTYTDTHKHTNRHTYIDTYTQTQTDRHAIHETPRKPTLNINYN